MARPIDEKLVVMKLDNSDFAKKASETTSVLGKLKNGLNKIPGVNLGKTSKELSDISSAASSANINPLAKSVEMVSGRFSALSVMATTALATITNQAVNAGMSLAKSLTLDQVTSGFAEYETKIGAIGTVLSNTEWAGTKLEDVNRVLADLNNYADNTIYNFGQMTENIGRFTAAGVKIDDAAIAIKGLSNLAAGSGSNVEQLNTAMYQMSQSMAAGKLGLEDWNSLVNAGMGGKKTQDALLATAKAMGKNVDMTDGFRMSLKDGWLTSEVFLKTMQKFGKDKSMTEAATAVRTFSGLMDSLKESIGSGWATTFEYIFGDFEESTKLWTSLSEVVGGWFGKTSDARNELIKGVADNGGMKNIFSGIQNAVTPVIQVFKALGDGFRKVFPPATVSQVVSLTEKFKTFTSGLKLSDSSMKNLTTIFQGAFSIFSSIGIIVSKVAGVFLNLIPPGTGSGVLALLATISQLAIGFNESLKSGNFLTRMLDTIGGVFGDLAGYVATAVTSLSTLSGAILNGLGSALDWLMDKLAPVGQFLKETFAGTDGIDGSDIAGAGMLVGIGIIVKKVMDTFDKFGGIFEGFKENTDDLIGSVKDVFDGLGDSLSAFVSSVKYDNLMKIAISIGILAVSLKLLEGISVEDIGKGITALAMALGIMMAGLALIDKFSLTGGIRASITIMGMASAIMVMAGALRVISSLSLGEIGRGMLGLAGIMTILVTAMLAMGALGSKIKTSSLQLIALSTAIVILSNALTTLSAINTGDLITGLLAMTAIFAQLALFLIAVDRTKLNPGSAIGVVLISSALLIMVQAIQQIASIDTMGLIAGLTTIALILGQIVIFSRLVAGPTLMASGAGLIMVAGALAIMAIPIQQFANMSWEELARGLTGMALALGAVVIAMAASSGALMGAVGITAMAVAINLLVPPLMKLSTMTWAELAKGLTALALGFGLIAGASLLLAPAVVPMLAFAAAVGVVGLAVLAAGVGIGAFGAGLAALASLTAASIASIVAALGLLLKGLADLIPAAVGFIVKLGSGLLSAINKLVPKLVNTVLNLVTKLLEAIKKYLPKFLKLGSEIVMDLMEGLGKYIPKLVDSGVKMIISFIDGLTAAVKNNGPKLTQSILSLLGEVLILFIQAGVQVINALFGWIPGVTDATAKIGSSAEETIRANFNAQDVGNEKGSDFSSALKGKTGDAKGAGKSIGDAAKDGMSGVKTESTGTNFMQGFKNGISKMKSGIMSTARGIANAAKSMMEKALDIHSPSRVTDKIGQHTGQGFANGIAKKKKEAEARARRVAQAAVNGFNTRMSTAKYKFDMEKINSKEYIAEIDKIKKSYSGYPKLVQKANLEVKRIQDKAKKERDSAKNKEAMEIKKSFSAKMDNAGYKFKIEAISSTQYIKELEKIKKAYSKYPEFVKKVNLEIKKTNDKMDKEAEKKQKEKEKKEKAKVDREKAAIADKKYYNKLSLTDELKAWERLQSKYKKGTEERKEADKEVYRLKNEINRKLIELNESYSAKIKATNDKLNADILAAENEFENLRKDKIKSLTGFAGLFDTVTRDTETSGYSLMLGLQSQIDVFKTFTSSLENLSGRGLDSSLMEELTQMGPGAADKIAALTHLTDEQLQEYVTLWKEKTALATEQADKELVPKKEELANKIEELKKVAKEELAGLQKEWKDAIVEIRTGNEKEFIKLSGDMKKAGTNAIKNLIKGMKDLKGDVSEEAKAIAKEIENVINQTLSISVKGVASGVSKTKSLVKSSAEDIATAAHNGATALVNTLIPDGVTKLRYKAVVDTAELDNISNARSLSVIPDTSKIAAYAKNSIPNTTNNQSVSTTNDNSRTFNPTINVEAGAGPKEIASENSKMLKRLSYEWGV